MKPRRWGLAPESKIAPDKRAYATPDGTLYSEDHISVVEATAFERADIVCEQLERWRNAWVSQDTSDAEPARKSMLKALDFYIKWKGGQV